MDYIEQMRNLRSAMHLISEKLPVIRLLQEEIKRNKNYDHDLAILAMCDREFEITCTAYDEIHEKITHFDPEAEYGRVETLSQQEMRGN